MGLNYGEECSGLELLRTVTVTASRATARSTRCLESGYFCDCLWQIRDRIVLRKPSGVRGTASQPEATARPNASVGFCGEYVARCFGGNQVAFVRRQINMSPIPFSPSLPYAFSPHYYHPTVSQSLHLPARRLLALHHLRSMFVPLIFGGATHCMPMWCIMLDLWRGFCPVKAIHPAFSFFPLAYRRHLLLVLTQGAESRMLN
jgi:hypothetical protein